MTAAPEPRTIRFPLAELAEQAEAFWQRFPAARAAADGRSFEADGSVARLWLPLVAPRAVAGERVGDFAERLELREEAQLVLLLQAGAMAFGCWRGEELLQHKAVRKYVVRGNGRSQATHLKTRGKSRYGSRLRLQNWKSLLAETNERVADCEDDHGPFARIFLGAPVRVFSDLFEVDPAPPFERDDARLQRLPLHVHRPDHGELCRVRSRMEVGRVVLPT
jgi:hypothetical protein